MENASKKQLPVKTARQQVACTAGWAKVFTSVTLWTKWTLVGPGDSTDQTRHQTQVRDVFCDGYWMLWVFFKGQFKFRMVFGFCGWKENNKYSPRKTLKVIPKNWAAGRSHTVFLIHMESRLRKSSWRSLLIGRPLTRKIAEMIMWNCWLINILS